LTTNAAHWLHFMINFNLIRTAFWNRKATMEAFIAVFHV